VTYAALGGVPTAEVTIDGTSPRHVVLYFHGGVCVLGDAVQAAGLAAQVARRTSATVISVDYRLAPEHPYPAAVDDALAAYQALLDKGTAPSDIAFAGESAGGGLAVATLVNARDRGLPSPPPPTSCPPTPTSPWPAPRWAPSATPTRCSAQKPSRPGSRTTEFRTTEFASFLCSNSRGRSPRPPGAHFSRTAGAAAGSSASWWRMPSRKSWRP
jgi:hypothetical protein